MYYVCICNMSPNMCIVTRVHTHVCTHAWTSICTLLHGDVCSLLACRYCQKRLPSDDFYHPVPIFRISKLRNSSFSDSMYEEVMNTNEQYRCTITMPTSCPLLDPIIVSWLWQCYLSVMCSVIVYVIHICHFVCVCMRACVHVCVCPIIGISFYVIVCYGRVIQWTSQNWPSEMPV